MDTAGSAVPSGAQAVAVDPAGDVVAAGFHAIDCSTNLYAVKLRGDQGTKIWERYFSGDTCPSPNQANALAVSAAFPHDVAVVGYQTNSGSQRDMAVYKLAGTTGATRWSVSNLAGSAAGGYDEARAVALSGEDLIVAGVTSNTGTNRDFTVIKLSDSGLGSEVWRYSPPTSNADSEMAYSVAVDASGDVIAGGTTQSTTSVFDFTVVKLRSANGSQLWPGPKKIDGTATGSWDAAQAIALVPVAGEPDDVIAEGDIEAREAGFEILGLAAYPRPMGLEITAGGYYILSLESIQTGAGKNPASSSRRRAARGCPSRPWTASSCC